MMYSSIFFLIVHRLLSGLKDPIVYIGLLFLCFVLFCLFLIFVRIFHALRSAKMVYDIIIIGIYIHILFSERKNVLTGTACNIPALSSIRFCFIFKACD